MAESDIKIVVETKNYIDLHGGNYPFWYVGLAEYPEEELIARGVNLDLDHCIYLTTSCSEDARGVEHYFVTRLGTDGVTRGSGDKKALSVYAYKKNVSTHP